MHKLKTKSKMSCDLSPFIAKEPPSRERTFAKLSRAHRGAGLCYWPRSRSRSLSCNKPNLSVQGWGLEFSSGFKSRTIQGLAVPSAMDWLHFFKDMNPNNSQHAPQMSAVLGKAASTYARNFRQISSPENCFRILGLQTLHAGASVALRMRA